MKIIDYRVVSGMNMAALRKEVVTAIGEGWQPHGNLCLATECAAGYFFQAMVKYA